MAPKQALVTSILAKCQAHLVNSVSYVIVRAVKSTGDRFLYVISRYFLSVFTLS